MGEQDGAFQKGDLVSARQMGGRTWDFTAEQALKKLKVSGLYLAFRIMTML